MKIIIFLFFYILAHAANLSQTIQKNNKMIYFMNKKLDLLAYQIRKKENNIKKLNKKIQILSRQIKNLETQLKQSNLNLKQLLLIKEKYTNQTKQIQQEIIDFVSENYINSLNKIENINDLIKKEITNEILEKYSKKIASLINKNKNLIRKIVYLNKKIEKISTLQKQLKNKQKQLFILKNKLKKDLLALKQQKIFYKQKLQNLIAQQKALQEKLKNLQIIKKRKYYNSYYKETYSGLKTIPPIKGEIVKKFGSYIDPVYNLKIDNPSITIKPYRPNEVVRAIMDGKVVYIGESHSKKVIIIKHKNNMFSIYANLDKVSPLLKKGSIVRKGQIIARVNHSLEFEVTYKDKPINPLKVINLK